MSGDNFTDGKPKICTVLGDITNRPVKRGFSSTSDKLGFISNEEGDSQFMKQVCLGVEKFIKEKSKKPRLEPNPSFPPQCSAEIVTLKEDMVSVDEKASEAKEKLDLSDSEETIGQGEGVMELGDPATDSGWIEGKDLGIGRLASSKGGCIEWSRLPKSSLQSSRPFELERCGGLKNDGCANLNAGPDMLKACSCHFCLKAAYIWSDLHYQDIKGRIAVLKKSQKEASILVQKSGGGKQADIPSQGCAHKSSNLESDLTSQWRLLFRSMEDMFVHESSQLQASFLALKDLREHCKMDLEQITGVPSEK